MKRNFIVDQEINLLDDADFLNTKVYSNTLRKMIINSPKNKPFTIGLFGEWGSGKSSIIKTAKQELEKHQTFKAKFALFDAWKYSEDAFRRSFILSLAKDLKINLNKREYNLYENHTQQIEELKIKPPKWFWAVAILIPLLLIAGYVCIPWFKTNILALVSLISLSLFSSAIFISLKKIVDKDLITKALGFIQSLIHTKYDEVRPLMFSPEQFSKAFEHIIEKGAVDVDKLVIVIDNIDRCEKHYATELLSTIKGFLESNEKVLFIMPVDESSLKRHLKETFKADDREADEFLRKFFNATLRIKPYQTSEIYVFAKEINKKFSLNFSDYTLDLVSKEYASNPRRIIQMFNNLSAELECYSDDAFIKQYETLICKLLIVREEFPQYYNLLSRNPYLINMDQGNFNTQYKGIWNKNLENFLKKTSVISETVGIKVISQILSNSIVFNVLPAEIEGYIDNLQMNEIQKFISGDINKLSTVTDYLIQQLDTYREREIIGNVFVNSFDILIFFAKDKLLTKTINMRIEEVVKPVLNNLFDLKKDLKEILIYSVSLQEHQRHYIVDRFLSSIDNQINLEKPAQKWLDALETGIKIYQDKRTLKRLSKPFKIAYEIDRGCLDRVDLTADKINALIDKDFYTFVLQKLASFTDEDIYFSDLKLILTHDKLSQDVANLILKKVNEICPNFTSKSVTEISTIIRGINSLMSMLNVDLVTSNELQVLLDMVSADRMIHNPNYPNLRQYDTTQNYVSEIIAGQDSIDLLFDFYFNVYWLTTGRINIHPFLNQVLTDGRYQEQLNIKILDLLSRKEDITSLFDIIVKDTSYTENSYTLLQEAFTENPNGLTDELRQQKLTEILNLIENDDARKNQLIQFLEKLSSDNKIKGILSTLISAKSKASILKLSKRLQSLAIDKVLDGEKIFDFSSNIDFLKVIAETGTKNHVSKLVKDIISKLQHKDQHANAIAIISEIKNISTTDSNRIIHELENQSIENITKEEIGEIIKTLKKTAKS